MSASSGLTAAVVRAKNNPTPNKRLKSVYFYLCQSNYVRIKRTSAIAILEMHRRTRSTKERCTCRLGAESVHSGFSSTVIQLSRGTLLQLSRRAHSSPRLREFLSFQWPALRWALPSTHDSVCHLYFSVGCLNASPTSLL